VGLVPWFHDICTNTYPLDLKGGGWGVPEAPGLGIKTDEIAAARHPFKQEEIPALEAILPGGSIVNW